MLITGGLGFIGSAFLRYVFKNKLVRGNVINLDSMTYAADLNNVEEIAQSSHYHFIKGSILDGDLLERLYREFSFQEIVHFAAETHVDNSIASPKSFIETNILGTFELLEFVRRNKNVRLHIISTDEVYGSLPLVGEFHEESPFRPNSPYAASKASADLLARSYVQTYQLNITTSHASNNFGPGQHAEKFLPKMISHLKEGRPLPVYGQGINVRDWLYVEDHAEAIWTLLRASKRGSVYNIGGRNEWRNIDLLYLLIDVFSAVTGENPDQLRGLIQFVEDRKGHDLRYALSNDKIEKEFSWTPRHTMEEGLLKTIHWYLDEKRANLLCDPSSFSINALSP
jgi:dTDP-glucose 4,6-dehydratase